MRHQQVRCRRGAPAVPRSSQLAPGSPVPAPNEHPFVQPPLGPPAAWGRASASTGRSSGRPRSLWPGRHHGRPGPRPHASSRTAGRGHPGFRPGPATLQTRLEGGLPDSQMGCWFSPICPAHPGTRGAWLLDSGFQQEAPYPVSPSLLPSYSPTSRSAHRPPAEGQEQTAVGFLQCISRARGPGEGDGGPQAENTLAFQPPLHPSKASLPSIHHWSSHPSIRYRCRFSHPFFRPPSIQSLHRPAPQRTSRPHQRRTSHSKNHCGRHQLSRDLSVSLGPQPAGEGGDPEHRAMRGEGAGAHRPRVPPARPGSAEGQVGGGCRIRRQ